MESKWRLLNSNVGTRIIRLLKSVKNEMGVVRINPNIYVGSQASVELVKWFVLTKTI
jgi:hypothetical protein